MSKVFEVSAEDAFDRNGSAAVLIKLSAEIVEVNIYIPIDSIGEVKAFEAKAIHQCTAGQSAASPVHWKRGDEGDVYILIGDDDDTWDIGLTVNDELVSEIVESIESLLPKNGMDS